jgi:alpha-beta hydrolase superfamily lysophospholipase
MDKVPAVATSVSGRCIRSTAPAMTERVALPVQRIRSRSTPSEYGVDPPVWDHGAMDETTFSFPSSDGTAIHVYRWTGEGDAKAVVQIEHGMGEHAARYRRLAEALTGAGYAVVADDHRGHGVTAGGPEGHGDLGPDGWEGLVGDIGRLSARARGEFPDVPLVVLGHSMGSFALQQYLLDHSGDLDAAVLTGTSAIDVIGAGIDPDAEVDLSAFNAPFEQRTGYEWLSRDEAEVDAYVADDGCGFGLNPAGARGMLEGVSPAADPARLAGIRSDLPILLVSGDADPLAGGGPLVQMVGDRYTAAGVHDVTVMLYPQARHEVFNETNRDDVTADLLAWLDRVTQG